MTNTIKPLKKLHYPAIIAIADQCFGPDYLSIEYLEKYELWSSQSLIIQLGSSIIGFCMTYVYHSPEDLFFLDISELTSHLNQVNYPGSIIKTIAILPEYQLKGYGTQLINSTLNRLLDQECKTVLYPAWIENNRQPFTNKLETIGFKPLVHLNNYWRKESIEKNYHCIRCGEPPCSCSMTLYLLELV